ncbi:MAG: glycosyltransferase [Elusimicrobiota bacterium]|jgi:abequosyltransferase|nr:glycosyltransferase [Elusimicrobiota bacterium]
MNFEISICIFTRNRERYLKVALDSIICQITDDIRDKVEICISDNASNQDIKGLADKYRQKHPHITYFRFDKDMGVDINHLNAVAISRSPYCWTFCDDDIMLDGALKYILQEIKENPDIDIFIGETIIYTKSLDEPAKSKFRLAKPSRDFIFEQGNTKGILLLGFGTETIVRKEKWQLYSNDNKFLDTLFVQLYVMFSMIKNGSKLKSLIKPICGLRGFNGDDTFNVDGMLRRFQYDIIALKAIPEDVFGKKSKEAKMMANQIMFNILAAVRALKMNAFKEKASLQLYFQLFDLLHQYYRNNILLYILVLPSLLLPSFIYKIMIYMYRKTLKKRRTIKDTGKIKELFYD